MAIKDALGIDDISGFQVKYKDLKTQWDGIRTVDSEFDTKHPQLTPATPGSDSRPLKDPRPSSDDDSAVASWHLLEGVGSNSQDADSQIEDVGRWTMHFGAST